MKKGLNTIQKTLLVIICVLAVILAAVLIYKGYSLYQDRIKQQELEVRHQEVQSELEDVQVHIQELSEDSDALQQFLDENTQKTEAAKIEKQEDAVAEDAAAEEVQEVTSESVVTETLPPESVTANEQPADEIYGEGEAIVIDIPEMAKPQKTEKAESVSVNQTEEEPEESISGNEIETDAEATVSGNAIVNGEVIPFRYESRELTLEERRNTRTSYVETMQVNGEDKARIAGSSYDFTDMKITCLGDSITAGSNLENMENSKDYSYPVVLKNILHAEEVYNLGIGGSSYGRYWDKAFVDRYKEIPEDSDVIIVMGGTNDGFAASSEELGNIRERKSRTFYGDVDELMRGLTKNYPNAKIIFATPLPNVLHDYLMNQRDYLLPQSLFAGAVKELAAEYNIDVIDLYNSNLLDTHDAQIISTYMPDGVHGNPAGYQILAEHLASEVIDIMERDALYGNTVSGNSPAGETVSGNSVSGNAGSDHSVSSNQTLTGGTSEDKIASTEHNEPDTEERAREKAIEEKQAKENNKKAADAAVVITPPAKEEKEAEQSPEVQSESVPEPEEAENNYEYDGEAIIIQ